MANLIDACKEKAKIEIWNAADIGVQTRDVGLEGSLTNVAKTFAPKFQREGEILKGDTLVVVKELVAKLKENMLI